MKAFSEILQDENSIWFYKVKSQKEIKEIIKQLEKEQPYDNQFGSEARKKREEISKQINFLQDILYGHPKFKEKDWVTSKNNFDLLYHIQKVSIEKETGLIQYNVQILDKRKLYKVERIFYAHKLDEWGIFTQTI